MTTEIEDKLELFKELSVKFKNSSGGNVRHNSKTWTSKNYFSLLGQLKSGLDKLEVVNFEINWLYEKYKRNIPNEKLN